MEIGTRGRLSAGFLDTRQKRATGESYRLEGWLPAYLAPCKSEMRMEVRDHLPELSRGGAQLQPSDIGHCTAASDDKMSGTCQPRRAAGASTYGAGLHGALHGGLISRRRPGISPKTQKDDDAAGSRKKRNRKQQSFSLSLGQLEVGGGMEGGVFSALARLAVGGERPGEKSGENAAFCFALE